MRNLPWECSEEELIELCKPFGKVVNTKVNVGANHNQAFVEFVSTHTKKTFFRNSLQNLGAASLR
jgi:RNA recognition motif-containing protein